MLSAVVWVPDPANVVFPGQLWLDKDKELVFYFIRALCIAALTPLHQIFPRNCENKFENFQLPSPQGGEKVFTAANSQVSQRWTVVCENLKSLKNRKIFTHSSR